MKRMLLPVLVPVLGLLACSAYAMQFSEVQTISSQITFVSKQMGVPVEGRFGKFAAQLAFDPAKPDASKARIDIDLASIDAGSEDANKEVRSKSWFNTTTYPTASFVASSVKPLGGNRYEVRGQLSIKGRSKDTLAVFNLKQDGKTAVFEGAFPFKRSEFGVGEGAWADPSVVADEVQVRFRLLANAK